MATLKIGYNTPAGERNLETVDPATFPRDLMRVCDVAATFADAFWVPDHLMRNRYRLECWTQLTWLAARYPEQQLGGIVMCNSFRHPPLMAKAAATIQALSGGRLVLGYGAGHQEEEYTAYGYPYPSTRRRIEQMVEGIQTMRAIWTEEEATFTGAHYQISGVHATPRPDPIPPIMVGGDGERFLLRAVAEHADWWLSFSTEDDVLRHKLQVLEDHCAAIGRDADSIVKVYPRSVFLAPTREEAERAGGSRLDRTVEPPIAVSPDGLVEHLERVRELGFDAAALAFAGFPDTTDLELFRDRVLPQLG